MKRCPIKGCGCRPRRHGYYWRKFPVRMAIARFYCLRNRTTISLLPDFLSSRYRGELSEFEQVCVDAAHNDSVSVASEIRPVENAAAISERAAKRWVARRLALFAITVRALLGVAVEKVRGVHTASQLRTRLQAAEALVALRGMQASDLGALPPPLGFGPWPRAVQHRLDEPPHAMAPEPKAQSA